MRSRLMTLPPAASVMPSMRPSTWSGTPQIMRLRRLAQPLGPALAHQVEVAADAAGGDDRRPAPSARSRRRPLRELARRARPRSAPGSRRARRRPRPPWWCSSLTRWRKRSDTSPCFAPSRTRRDERRDDAGPRAPGDVEARHRVAVLGGQVAAALGPADDRETSARPWHAARRASRRPRRRHRPRPSLRGQWSSCAIEAGRAHPVLQREVVGVADAHAPLLGASRRRTGRRTTRTPARPATARPPGRAGSPCAPASISSAVGDEPGEPAADDDGIRVHPAPPQLSRLLMSSCARDLVGPQAAASRRRRSRLP